MHCFVPVIWTDKFTAALNTFDTYVNAYDNAINLFKNAYECDYVDYILEKEGVHFKIYEIKNESDAIKMITEHCRWLQTCDELSLYNHLECVIDNIFDGHSEIDHDIIIRSLPAIP